MNQSVFRRTASTLIRLPDAQADLSFRLTHTQYCRKNYGPAHIPLFCEDPPTGSRYTMYTMRQFWLWKQEIGHRNLVNITVRAVQVFQKYRAQMRNCQAVADAHNANTETVGSVPKPNWLTCAGLREHKYNILSFKEHSISHD